MAGIDEGGTAQSRGEMNEANRKRKTELRREMRGRLQALTTEEHKTGSAAIRQRLEGQPVWISARAILAYMPIAQEPDIWPSLAQAWSSGKQIAMLRHSPETDRYVPCLVQDRERDLQTGQFGILEPRPHCPIFDLMRLDLALVPGIGFTLNGGRLGRGKGYYDRLLAGVPALKCGVAFDCQIASEFPLEPHDIQLNCILTPTRWQIVGGHARS